LIFINVAIILGGKQLQIVALQWLQIVADGHAEHVAEEVMVELKAS
jgi:hypothetical protein